jgi:hypothetical protein
MGVAKREERPLVATSTTVLTHLHLWSVLIDLPYCQVMCKTLVI